MREKENEIESHLAFNLILFLYSARCPQQLCSVGPASFCSYMKVNISTDTFEDKTAVPEFIRSHAKDKSFPSKNHIHLRTHQTVEID